MSESAIRGRRIRARNSATQNLREQGCYVWDVSHGGEHSTLVAFDPDVPTLREIFVCHGSTRMAKLGKIYRRRGVSLEIWHRNIGETCFEITKI
jgi:hypothetical protein